MDDKTIVFDNDELNNTLVKEVMEDVYFSLEEIGYNPTKQITGYLISGDLGYISNNNEARKKIAKLDREQILEVLLSEFLNKK